MPSRRHFLASAGASLVAAPLRAVGFEPQISQVPDLAGQLGLVSASLSKQIAGRPTGDQFMLFDFPKIMRDELDLTVLDLNTMNFDSLKEDYVVTLRVEIDEAKCVATNLKMNQKVDMASADDSERSHAMSVYKQSIDAAKILGCHWVRPLPRNETPDRKRLLEAFDELVDYAGERGITLLIENFGWMMNDPDSVVKLADEIGPQRVAVGPDTGNWTTNEVRYSGLEMTFPRAVTCDFKAKGLGPNGEHTLYSLKRCFEIGWDAGFRGPWNFEYGHADRATAFRGIGFLRDSLREWMKEKG